MKDRVCLGCLLLLAVCVGGGRNASGQRRFDAAKFGALGDGRTVATAALQRALDAAASAGGGTVELPQGTYVSGALFIKSHTHLVVGAGTTLIGTTDKAAYPLVDTRAAGIEMKWPAALLNVDGQTDVSIEGTGTIDGNGKTWWDAFWTRVPDYEKRGLRWAVDYDVQRPELIRVYRSHGIRIGGGLLLKRSAFWTVHIAYSTDATVSGVTIRDNDPVEGLGPSTDGVDIDSSSHVLVEKVDIANNDDGICLKAGMNADGLRVNRPTEDVVIRDSVIREGISGIAFGSDTAGGFRNVHISNIKMLAGVRYGIYLKSTHTRGGWTKDIRFDHIEMEGVKTGIKIDLNYFPAFSTPRIPDGIEHNLPPGLTAIPAYWHTLAAPVSPDKGTPHFRDVTFSDVRGTGLGTAIEVKAAADAPMESFALQHIRLEAEHAGNIHHTLGWRLDDVTVHAKDGPVAVEDMRNTSGKIASSIP